MKARITKEQRWLHASAGFAIVAVLVIIIIITVMVTVFLSSSRFDFTSSNAFSRNVHAEQLAISGGEEVVSLLSREARLAGEQSTTNAPVGILPARIGASAADPRASRLVRRSTGDDGSYAAAFSLTGVANPPPNLASTVPSSQVPRQGRPISEARWRMPRLLKDGESFSFPDWVYVTRNGAKDVGSLSLSSLANTGNPANADAVVGRFAYMVYDLGGIFDVRMAGSQASNASPFTQKGGTPSSDLAGLLTDAGASAAADFLAWRIPNASDEAELIYGVDPAGGSSGKRGFLDDGELALDGKRNTMFSRRDLLQFADAYPSRIPPDALPALRTLSASMSAPEIAQTVPGAPGYLKASATLQIPWYTGEGALEPYTVKAGEPVFQRRFPLSRLRWFAERAADGSPSASFRSAIKQHFGLTWVDDLSSAGGVNAAEFSGVPGWVYTSPDGAAAASSIKSLAQVAALGREPDLFEWLKAALPTGALGQSLGATYLSAVDKTLITAQDQARDFQIIQLGANIIDQADPDDVPTLIASKTASNRKGGALVAFGVENLPYLNEMPIALRYDESDRARLKAWFLFELWNPHQQAALAKKDAAGQPITRVRARIVEGQSLLEPYLRVISDAAAVRKLAASRRTSIPRTFTGDPSTDACTVDITTDAYSEPRIAGDSAAETSGVLATEGGRSLRGGPAPGQSVFRGVLAGEAIAANPIWPRDTRVLNTAGVTSTSIADPATGGTQTFPCGVKYWNAAGLSFTDLTTNSPPSASPAPATVVMEVEAGGRWIPYQTIERLSNAADSVEYPQRPLHFGSGGSNHLLPFDQYYVASWQTPAAGDPDPYPAATASSDLNARLFYGWNGTCNYSGVFKIDPRTRRFAAHINGMGTPGASIRDSSAAWDGKPNNLQSNWDSVNEGGAVALANYAINKTSALGMYQDPDGVQRPGDFANIPDADFPTIPGKSEARPVVLNRPFRSVAELGLVFRDAPWKSFDFFSAKSADLKLFDVFSVEDTLVAEGRVNPNTADVATLAAILKNASRNPSSPTASLLSQAEATAAAQHIYQYINPAANAYFRNLSDVAERLVSLPGASSSKLSQEAFQRAVSGSMDTRTWNLLIDVIGQSGRLVQQAHGLEDFSVMAESRFWIFVAIDRYTGKVVALRREAVYE